ncbi:MAG TPA: hypothetical protein VLM79_36720 [Kofleriaceae bacterium]|nr:hypothetical protein [Kofleriaceae bacterium]
MARIASLFVCVCVAGCQRETGGTAPPVPEPYRADIATLCEVVVRSGADQVPAGERTLLIATWLSGHLQTAEAHEYLVKIGPLMGEAKAAALEAEAARAGLQTCALAAEWRTPAP